MPTRGKMKGEVLRLVWFVKEVVVAPVEHEVGIAANKGLSVEIAEHGFATPTSHYADFIGIKAENSVVLANAFSTMEMTCMPITM